MYKRSGAWRVNIRHNGKRIQKSLETSDKKLAKIIEAKIRTELAEGKYLEKPAGDYKTVKDMMIKFMEVHTQNVSANTISAYKSYKKHIDGFFGRLKLSKVSPKIISEYKFSRKNDGVKPATINRELAMFSKAFNLAVKEWEWTCDNPVSKVPNEKENNERVRWLSLDEEKSLLENCSGWLKDIIVFGLNTGFRQDEILSLTWSRVNFLRNTAMIENSKNGKPRTMPLNQTALEILGRQSETRSIKNDLVFISKNGTKINRHNLRRAFNTATKKAGIKDFRFHDLRHTFATRLVQKGIDIYKVAKLLGHKDIRMTQRYSHHCPESLRDGVDILSAAKSN